MAKEKTPEELGEILSGQIDAVIAPGSNDETRLRAQAVTNMVGKIMSVALSELKYQQAKKKRLCGTIPSLDRKAPRA
jgi:hypothetical protein